jgi:hypothetical protein
MGVSQSLDVSGIGHEHDVLVMAAGAGDTPGIWGQCDGNTEAARSQFDNTCNWANN